jgi:hypothetical protein
MVQKKEGRSMLHTRIKGRKWWTDLITWAILGGCLLTAGAATWMWYWAHDWARRDVENPVGHGPFSPILPPAGHAGAFSKLIPFDLDVYFPPVKQPKTFSASAVKLSEGTPIIGVNIAGKHRAYVLSALCSPSRHVINDLLGSRAVTISYCDLTDCVKVFTAAPSSAASLPLDIRVSGLRHFRSKDEGGMLITAKERRYYQISGKGLDFGAEIKFPYPELPFTRTSWNLWKKAHPDTDVYVGEKLALR